MNYLGEHTFWSELGRFFVALSFAGALLSAFFFTAFKPSGVPGNAPNAPYSPCATPAAGPLPSMP